MGLKREKKGDRAVKDQERRETARTHADLVALLGSSDVSQRRWAARDLAQFDQSTDVLFDALRHEMDQAVRDAIFDALQTIGGVEVVTGLIELLRTDDAALRNTAIELLQCMPEGVAQHIIELLNDQNSDVRIFAVDILQVLAHPKTPQWLLSVLKEETHINVVCTAVDRLAEVGTLEMIPELEHLKTRFPNQEYLYFAIDTAIKRIQGG